MTANPLTQYRPHVDGFAQLQAHVSNLNNYRWIVDSGKLYYIGSRQRADGTIEHFVDRHI